MVDRPSFRPLWRSLSVTDVARRLHVAQGAVQQALRTKEGQERIRQRLAEAFDIPADRLTIRPGPTGAVLVGDVWLEVHVADGWVAASRLAVQAGRLVVAEVRVFPDEDTALRRENPPGRWSAEVLGVNAVVPPGGLTARLLHSVRLGEYPQHLRDVIKFVSERLGVQAFEPGGSLAALGLAPEIERPRARRKFGREDRDYAELAREYVRLIEQGSRRPNAEIAAQRRKLLPDTFRRDTRGLTEKQVVAKVTGWLHEARNRGLLAPKEAKQGRPEGTLTAFAERVRREASRSPVHRTSTEKGVSKTGHQVGALNRRGKKTKRRKR